jgi:hypothetical protein
LWEIFQDGYHIEYLDLTHPLRPQLRLVSSP